MAKLTKADAARHLGIARSTLYKWIAQGTISATPDGMIDQAELVRVAAPVDTFEKRRRTSADTPETPTQREAETPRGGPQPAVDAQPWTDTRQPPQTSPDVVVDIWRDQIQTLRDALQEARQSAQAAREREALLLQMLQQMQQRYDRLLEAPRSVSPSTAAAPEPVARAPRGDMRRPSRTAVPPPGAAPREDAPYNAAAAAAHMPPVPEPAPPASTPPRHRGRPISLLRQRILTLLQAHPEGLSVEELRVYLKPGKPIGDLLQGMRKGGVITTRGRRPDRRYVIA